MSADEIRKRHDIAVMRGEQMFRAGKKTTENPYRLGTRASEYNSWMQGFEKAKSARRAGR
jgi:hypothetical protein